MCWATARHIDRASLVRARFVLFCSPAPMYNPAQKRPCLAFPFWGCRDRGQGLGAGRARVYGRGGDPRSGMCRACVYPRGPFTDVGVAFGGNCTRLTRTEPHCRAPFKSWCSHEAHRLTHQPIRRHALRTACALEARHAHSLTTLSTPLCMSISWSVLQRVWFLVSIPGTGVQLRPSRARVMAFAVGGVWNRRYECGVCELAARHTQHADGNEHVSLARDTCAAVRTF